LVEFQTHTRTNGFFAENRRRQAQYWFQDTLEQALRTAFYNHPEVKARLQAMEKDVLHGTVSPFAAARSLVDALLKG
jgi:LAO/AO transport system kinase